MGVPGLWDILYDLGRSRSLANLTIHEGFEGNKSGRRAYRVGVDASLWYAHAAFAKGGENPDLRLLFFRCLQLAKLAIIPYFVFDGRKRPPIKRGSKKGKAGSHALTPGFKKILECFGWTWREAQGEAEAELAYLNREGIIDAVLTDDGDALIFGAKVVIRNQSNNLTGNKSKPALDLTGKPSKDHVMIFTEDALAAGGLDCAGLILIAMLCGGDYVQEGIKGFGRVTATALARAGFGQRLLDIYALRGDPEYPGLIARWRSEVHDELRTNSQGFLTHKHASLELPVTFPDLKVLSYYVNPETGRGRPAPQIRDSDSLCLPRLAAFCEKHFGEWGYEDLIIKRFRTLVWEPTLHQLLRRAAVQVDELERERLLRRGDRNNDIQTVLHPAPAEAHGLSESFVSRLVGRREEIGVSDAFVNRPASRITSRHDESKNVLDMKVVGSTRKHTSTDGLLEYRVEFTPSLLVELTRLGISGKRGDPPPPSQADADPWDIDFGPDSSRPKVPKQSSKPPPLPGSPMRVWVCAAMLEQVFPDLLQEMAAKQAGKEKAPKAGQRALRDGGDHLGNGSSDVEMLRANSSPPPQHTTHRVPQPLRHTTSQPDARSSRSPARLGVTSSPTRAPLRPTQSRTYAAAPLTHAKPGFMFAFPYTDDPNMMLLEDGLDLPLATTSTRPPRPQLPTASAYQPLRRTSPPRANPPVRRTASEASRPSTSANTGSRLANRSDDMNMDIANLFGGGDSDDGGNETEPDIIRHASAATNNRMDHIFDEVFKPRGKGKGKAKTKRVASAPSASQARPVKKRRTAASPPLREVIDLPPLLPPPPAGRIPAMPVTVPTAYRNVGLAHQSSNASSSRAPSAIIEIDSDSDNDSDSIFPIRLSSPPSTRFDSDEESIIDLT